MDKIIQISEILRPDFIIDLQSASKASALEELLEVIIHSDKITDAKKFSKAIKAREKLMSTGIGYGIAVPHARDRSILDFVMAVGRSKVGVKYESIDDQPVQLIFMIGASDSQDRDYIKLLSRLVLRVKNDDLKNKIMSAESPGEIYEIIKGTR
ncbi:MAG: PTS sugar transporter subunit IIA [Candidatus Stygibacter australis]|nr:PTS sugar transporter subunit IIA [Candidatus Stygibacter australis]MDP8321350.1 PTS sugar transporter subunit IIA [Candidatus Stygibacter australis]